MSRLGNTVRKLREDRSLSMHELALRIKLSAEYIRRLEQGKELPNKKEIEALARELRTDQKNLLALMPRLDENLIVYLNSNHHVIQVVKAIASSNLKKDEIDILRQMIEGESLSISHIAEGRDTSTGKEVSSTGKKVRR